MTKISTTKRNNLNNININVRRYSFLELINKKKSEIIEIARKLGVASYGNKNTIVERIIKHYDNANLTTKNSYSPKKKTVITQETCVDRAKKAEQDAVATLEAFYMANTISKFEEIERERQEIALKERLTLEALLALNQKR